MRNIAATRARRARAKDISDVAAEILLIIITLAVGVSVLSYAVYLARTIESGGSSYLSYESYVVPMAAWTSGDKAFAAFETGPYGDELYQILVNGTPASCAVSVRTYGGQVVNYTTFPALLPANAVAVASCPLGSASGPAYVTIVTSSEEVEMVAQPP